LEAVEAEAGIGEAVIEAIKAEGFSPDGESFLLTLHILDEVRGDTLRFNFGLTMI
jgi:hypothetical protein